MMQERTVTAPTGLYMAFLGIVRRTRGGKYAFTWRWRTYTSRRRRSLYRTYLRLNRLMSEQTPQA